MVTFPGSRMRGIGFFLVLATWFCTCLPLSGHAQTAPGGGFPGAPMGRVIQGDTPEGLMRTLYAARDRRNPTYANPQFCGRTACKLHFLAADTWQGEDGAERILIVAGAEPANPAHASPALLGMAVLRRQGQGWKLESGSPKVDEIGEWGTPPPVSTVLAGGFGRGAVAAPQFTAQGVQLESWGLYVPIDDRIVKVLQLETAQDSAASCEAPDIICRRRVDAQDFSSTVFTEPASDGGLDVTQTVTMTARPNQQPEIRRWHIEPTGRIHVMHTTARRRDR